MTVAGGHATMLSGHSAEAHCWRCGSSHALKYRNGRFVCSRKWICDANLSWLREEEREVARRRGRRSRALGY